ncbi:CehA/McbA family metallohydrolase [Acetobacter sp. TBRC 12305]|uniref:CehA/McbA family metallohydrolase n=1 Tax=Acetobacter garciniae TaxID=2817435 RepID=A0A939HN54_9PROT|nr:CehA/McbA family metallohydrolase [Acetobacter garciniae]MBO1324472.1 CehA/McbA family metallohydrolase [Acetobacter garciniae]MBX0344161.1 CehA/McbA family metallohydrolase [Acetobacter garciniae]
MAMRLRCRTGLLVALLFASAPASAAVRVVVGPTPIPHGQANAAGDITIMNDRVAVAIAVKTAPPWAIPHGALIDAAPVTGGVIGPDRVTFADFLPNSWSAWPSDRQTVRIVEDTPAEAIVEAVRTWGQVEIRTRYILKDADDSVHLSVTMTNGGPRPVEKALSGFVLWSMGGYFFGVPGLPDQTEGPAGGALADRITAYDRDWAIAMHMPGFDRFGFGQKDLYRQTTLLPGQSAQFDGWLQIVPRGDLAPIVASEIQREGQGVAQISGRVSGADGTGLAAPVVVVEKNGRPLAWTLGQDGHYAFTLAPGSYRFYATGEGYANTPGVAVTLGKGDRRTQDFAGLAPPGRLHLLVHDRATGRPVDASIAIEQGQRPLVQYLGRHTFFTELDRIGQADIPLAVGDYVFSVQSGAGFTARPVLVKVHIRPGQTSTEDVSIERLFRPEALGWYTADMHHHSDQADGVTPPADLARSELAAGLDLLLVSDHDLTTNHRALQAIADQRGVPFIPSAEFSPSWGHFNAYPLRLGEPLRLEMAKATATDVYREARRLGATTIQVNHPDAPGEGYLASVDRGVAQGGLDPAYDLLEINGTMPGDDTKVLNRAWASWTTNHPYFLTAGSDTHDVWNAQSGNARLYAYVPGKLTVTGFIDAARHGHAFVSHGPLIFPDHMFGETFFAPAGGTVALGFDIRAVNGLKRVSIIRNGKLARLIDYDGKRDTVHVTVDAAGAADGWYALSVEDKAGCTAYTNPIWVRPGPKPAH